jgi:hypothetical protein
MKRLHPPLPLIRSKKGCSLSSMHNPRACSPAVDAGSICHHLQSLHSPQGIEHAPFTDQLSSRQQQQCRRIVSLFQLPISIQRSDFCCSLNFAEAIRSRNQERVPLKHFFSTNAILAMTALTLLLPHRATAQQPTNAGQQSGTHQTAGTVTSARRGSVVIKTEDGQFLVFQVDRDTVRSQAIQVGARVTVVTLSNDSGDTPMAIAINVVQPRPTTSAPASEPLPPEVQRLETQIEREVKRYRVGVEAGAGFGPELLSVGAHAAFGPIFNPNITFRPGVQIAVGEVTTLLALNLDVLYRLAGATRQTKWAPYIGAGPNFSFSHQSFQSTQDGNRFDFGQFNATRG